MLYEACSPRPTLLVSITTCILHYVCACTLFSPSFIILYTPTASLFLFISDNSVGSCSNLVLLFCSLHVSSPWKYVHGPVHGSTAMVQSHDAFHKLTFPSIEAFPRLCVLPILPTFCKLCRKLPSPPWHSARMSILGCLLFLHFPIAGSYVCSPLFVLMLLLALADP